MMRKIWSLKYVRITTLILLVVFFVFLGERGIFILSAQNVRICSSEEIKYIPLVNHSGDNYIILEGSNQRVWIGGFYPDTPVWINHLWNHVRLVSSDETGFELIKYIWHYDKPDDKCRIHLLVEQDESAFLINPNDYPSTYKNVNYYPYYQEAQINEDSIETKFDSIYFHSNFRSSNNFLKIPLKSFGFSEAIEFHSSKENALTTYDEFLVFVDKCIEKSNYCPCEINLEGYLNAVEGCTHRGGKFAIINYGEINIIFWGEKGEAWQALVPLAVEKIMTSMDDVSD